MAGWRRGCLVLEQSREGGGGSHSLHPVLLSVMSHDPLTSVMSRALPPPTVLLCCLPPCPPHSFLPPPPPRQMRPTNLRMGSIVMPPGGTGRSGSVLMDSRMYQAAVWADLGYDPDMDMARALDLQPAGAAFNYIYWYIRSRHFFISDNSCCLIKELLYSNNRILVIFEE